MTPRQILLKKPPKDVNDGIIEREAAIMLEIKRRPNLPDIVYDLIRKGFRYEELVEEGVIKEGGK
jgi:hypothetical protein